MRIFAFDPGAVATGLGVLQNYGQPVLSIGDVSWYQYTLITDLYDELIALRPNQDDVVLIEDYSHGGAFTAEAKMTLEIIGFLKYQAVRDGFRVVIRHKDKRLSGQSEAARLMSDTVTNLKKDLVLKDAFSALSHCITYKREMDNVRHSGA